MFDMSWGEVMVIGAVALIVIGPKDLPKALRTVGQVTAKVRRLAGEFQSQFNEAMREAELDDVKRQVDGINRSVASSLNTSFDPVQTIRDELKGAVEGTKTPPAVGEPAPATSEPAIVAAAPDAMPQIELPPPLDPPDPASPMPRDLDPVSTPSERPADPLGPPSAEPPGSEPREKAGIAPA